MAGSVQPRQLAFALPHAESLSRDDFLEGPSNAQALADRQADAAAVNPVLPPTNGGPTAKEQEEGFELKIAEEINNMRGYRA